MPSPNLPQFSARQEQTEKVFAKKTPPTAINKPEILAIGSSTGGPNALREVLKDLNNFPLPIVITQHMPKTFTAILAGHINQIEGIECSEGADGMILEPGKVYIAPGGSHMCFEKKSLDTIIKLNDGPPECFCKPSVNPMMRSLVDIYQSRIMAVILTGMGDDGLEGCKKIVEAGGRVIAQDAETSVVYVFF